MAVVEKTIDIIGDDVFCKILMARKIPDGMPVDIYDEDVQSIRAYGLRRMEGLQSAEFVNVTKIGTYSFAECPNLKRVSLPKCLRIDGNYAFRDCSELETVDLPAVEYAAEGSFVACPKLTSISLPSLTSCTTSLFASATGLLFASIPRLRYMSAYAFNACRAIKQIDLPSVTYIGELSMSYCDSLEVVNIGPNIATIHASAFRNTPDGLVINMAVAEGVVANAPWGAPNATINYDVPYSGDVPMPES